MKNWSRIGACWFKVERWRRRCCSRRLSKVEARLRRSRLGEIEPSIGLSGCGLGEIESSI